MKKEQFLGQWQTLKGLVREKWGKLTEDDISQIEGKREQLLGFLQKRYGYDKEHAEKELDAWERQIETEQHTQHRT
jgi:uncharacterized protein YjbJ (UPF0337 family)